MSESFEKVQAILNRMHNSTENLSPDEKNENKEEDNNQTLSAANNSNLNTNIIASSEGDAVSSPHEQADKHPDAAIVQNDTSPSVLLMSNYVIAENFIVPSSLEQEIAERIMQGHPLAAPSYFTTNDHEDDLMLVPVENNFSKDLVNTLEAYPNLIKQPFEEDFYLYHFATII